MRIRFPWACRYLAMGMAMGLTCALTGCEVGPNYKAPADNLHAAYQASTSSTATQPVQRWWETFNDSHLNDLVGRATRSNLDLRLANARIREARAQRDIENAAFFPTVNLNGLFNRQQVSKNAAIAGTTTSTGNSGAGTGGTGTGGTGTGGTGTGGTGTGTGTSTGITSAGGGGFPTRFNFYEAGFDAAWEIDVFGGVARSVEAATADIQAQEEARRDSLVTLLGDVARNYIIVRGTQREIRIAEENIRSQEDTVGLTRSRFAAGLASNLEVAQAEAQVATSQSTLPTLTTEEQQAIHRLAILMGEPPLALETELSDVQPIPPAPPSIPIGLPSDLLRRRADVRKTERQLAAATARIGVAASDLFPRFSLTGDFGVESQRLHDLARGSSIFWNVGPAVSWPVFDAGRIFANIRLQDARTREALIVYQQTVLGALEDVSNALTAYEQEQRRWHALSEAVNANKRATDLANQLYTKGLVDFLNVLEAQRNLFAAQDALIQSEQTVSSNLVALYKALGGGWEPFETSTDPTTNPTP